MSYNRDSEGGWLNYTLLPSYMQDNPKVMRDKMLQETVNDIRDSLSEQNSLNNYLLEQQQEQQMQMMEATNEAIRNSQEMMQRNNDAVISSLSRGFSSLANAFESKFALFENVIEEHSIKIKKTLDNISESLSNPTITKANEFRDMAIDRMKKGLLDKALESFLKSYDLNDTDFFVNFQIGKIYLYGNIEDNNLIDLDKSEKFLKAALRYVDAEEKQEDINICNLKTEILLENAQVNLVKTNELYIKENRQLTDNVKQAYIKTLNYAKQCCDIATKLKIHDIQNNALVMQARINIYLDNKQEALKAIYVLLENDIKFIYFLRKDSDFKNIIDDINNIFFNVNPKNEEDWHIKIFELIKSNNTEFLKKTISQYINITDNVYDLIKKYKKIKGNNLINGIIEEINKTVTKNKIIEFITNSQVNKNTELVFEQYNSIIESNLFKNIIEDVNNDILTKENINIIVKVYILIAKNNIEEAKKLLPNVIKNNSVAYYIIKNHKAFSSLKESLEEAKKQLYFESLNFKL